MHFLIGASRPCKCLLPNLQPRLCKLVRDAFWTCRFSSLKSAIAPCMYVPARFFLGNISSPLVQGACNPGQGSRRMGEIAEVTRRHRPRFNTMLSSTCLRWRLPRFSLVNLFGKAGPATGPRGIHSAANLALSYRDGAQVAMGRQYGIYFLTLLSGEVTQ